MYNFTDAVENSCFILGRNKQKSSNARKNVFRNVLLS